MDDDVPSARQHAAGDLGMVYAPHHGNRLIVIESRWNVAMISDRRWNLSMIRGAR